MTITTTGVTTGILYHCHHPHFPRVDMTVTTTGVTTGILYHCHHPHFWRANILPICPTFDVNGGTAGQDHNIGSGADRPWRFRCHGCHAGRWCRHAGLIGHCSTHKTFLDGAVCVCVCAHVFSLCVCVRVAWGCVRGRGRKWWRRLGDGGSMMGVKKGYWRGVEENVGLLLITGVM